MQKYLRKTSCVCISLRASNTICMAYSVDPCGTIEMIPPSLHKITVAKQIRPLNLQNAVAATLSMFPSLTTHVVFLT